MPSIVNVQGESSGLRKIVRLQRHAIADLPAEPVREGATDDGAGAIGIPGLLAIGGEHELGVHLQKWLGSTANCAKKFFGSW